MTINMLLTEHTHDEDDGIDDDKHVAVEQDLEGALKCIVHVERVEITAIAGVDCIQLTSHVCSVDRDHCH